MSVILFVLADILKVHIGFYSLKITNTIFCYYDQSFYLMKITLSLYTDTDISYDSFLDL